MIRITDNHAQRLRRLAPAPIMHVMGEQLERNAELLVRDAQQSIMDGSGSGRVSFPGDPPNNQTGALHDSGFTTPAEEVGNEVKAAAGFGTDYALYLEYGTSKMHPRPFLAPATERQRSTTLQGLAARFREIVGLR